MRSFFLSRELPHFVIQQKLVWAIFPLLKPWSFRFKKLLFGFFCGSSPLINGKNVKNTRFFDTKSLQTWELPTGSSKYVQNLVLFKKHRILRYKIKTPLKFRFAEAKTMVASAFCDQKKNLFGRFFHS